MVFQVSIKIVSPIQWYHLKKKKKTPFNCFFFCIFLVHNKQQIMITNWELKRKRCEGVYHLSVLIKWDNI